MAANNDNKPWAVLVGLDTMQGLQAARILAGHGIPVVAIARDPDHHACRTRVCREILYGDTTGEELPRLLSRLGPTLPGRAVLFPCHDQAVAQVSRHRESLAPWYHVMMADAATIAMLMDKVSLYEFAGRHGFRVPGTFLLHDRSGAEQAAAALRFPAVLKPSQRSATWDARTKAKAYPVASREELLRTYDAVRDWAPVLIAQEWIPGTDADLYSLNCYFDRHGELAGSFVARKLRQWPPLAGSSCSGEEVRNDTVLAEGLRLLRLAGYHGLAYVEMKRDARSGEHFLIEANLGRPTGRSAIAEAGGVELLHAMYCDAAGLPRPAHLTQAYRGVKWLDLRHDIQSALYYRRRGELTMRGWWRSLRGRKAHAIFSWSDPLPFLWDLWRALRIAASRGERARRRHEAPPASAAEKSNS